MNPDGTVRGGTLRDLVARLTLHDKRGAHLPFQARFIILCLTPMIETSFIDAFLLTYRSFTTSTELFHMLRDRFNIPPPEGLLPEELTEWTERKRDIIRLRYSLNPSYTSLIDAY